MMYSMNLLLLSTLVIILRISASYSVPLDSDGLEVTTGSSTSHQHGKDNYHSSHHHDHAHHHDHGDHDHEHDENGYHPDHDRKVDHTEHDHEHDAHGHHPDHDHKGDHPHHDHAGHDHHHNHNQKKLPARNHADVAPGGAAFPVPGPSPLPISSDASKPQTFNNENPTIPTAAAEGNDENGSVRQKRQHYDHSHCYHDHCHDYYSDGHSHVRYGGYGGYGRWNRGYNRGYFNRGFWGRR